MPNIPGQEIILSTRAVGMHYVASPSAKTVLYCHGNAGNISFWRNIIELMYHSRVNIFIFDYRGFGKSPGIPIITSMIDDTFAAYDYLRKEIKAEDIVLWGESLGGHFALRLATKRDVGCLALAASFSHSNAVAEYLELPEYQKMLAKIEPLDNIKLIKRVPSKIPVVIIHSREDDVISPDCADRLFAASPSSCKDQIWIDGTHSKPALTRENLEWLFDFCQIESSCRNVDPILKKICQDSTKACPFRSPKKNEQASRTPP